MRNCVLLLLLGVLGVSAQTFTCSVTNNPVFCSALGDLYYATSGAGWFKNAGWTSAAVGNTTNYCTFSGATCIGDILQKLCVCRIWCCSFTAFTLPALLSASSAATSASAAATISTAASQLV